MSQLSEQIAALKQHIITNDEPTEPAFTSPTPKPKPEKIMGVITMYDFKKQFGFISIYTKPKDKKAGKKYP